MDLTPQSSADVYKITEERTGLTRDTVRFYERSGLITPPRRQQAVREQIELHRRQLRRLDELVERFSGV